MKIINKLINIGDCNELKKNNIDDFQYCIYKDGVYCNLFNKRTKYDHKKDMTIGLRECDKLKKDIEKAKITNKG
jgi:hypothetical protein